MKITIKYCPTRSGYNEKALEVSKELNTNLENVEVELIEGGKDEFSVIYEDDPPALLFSKEQEGRFPTNNEVTGILIGKYGCDNRKLRSRGI